MKICLVRHGQTDWNAEDRWQGQEDIALNELGREQAQFAALLLAKYKWGAVYSSPLQRALETAQIIATAIDISKTPKILDGLQEKNFGDASGLTRLEAEEKFPDGIVPNSEDWEAMTQRTMAALEVIAEEYHEENVIVVTHGGNIWAALKKLLGDKYDKELPPKNLAIDINVLEKKDEGFEVLMYHKSANEVKNDGIELV